MAEAPQQKFNSDLLLSDVDRERARASFPAIHSMLDFPELQKLFLHYDAMANGAKRWLRATGLLSVCLGVIALLGISGEPVYQKYITIPIDSVGAFFAAAGVLSITFGLFGVFNTRFKRRWLQCRLMTERIRQFQFQTLVKRIPAKLDERTRDEFIALRDKWLARFLLDYEAQLPGRLQDVLADEEEEDIWILCEEVPERAVVGSKMLDEYFSAYRVLRINHQIGYASYKLRLDRLRFPIPQYRLLKEVSLICILIVFAIHLAISISYMLSGKVMNGEELHVAVIWTAIIALTARTLEEGLQPTREAERYTHYKAGLGRLLYHFDHAPDLAARFRVMMEVERMVYGEMRGFLKTNDESKFVL